MSGIKVFVLSLCLSSQFLVGLSQSNGDGVTAALNNPLSVNSNPISSTGKPSMCYTYQQNVWVDYYLCLFENVHLTESDEIPLDYFAGDKESRKAESLVFKNSSMNRLPKELLVAYPNVSRLTVDGMQIRAIEEGVFKNATLLQLIYLKHNNITQLEPRVFATLSDLRTLSLEGNQISQLPASLFTSNKNLKRLSMADNLLTRIEDSTFSHISDLMVEVNFTRNNIEHFDLSQISQIITIDVRHNRLTEVRITSMLKGALYASNNRINRVITNGENESLKVLHLDHNNLTNISWLKLFPKLKTLNLAHNEIAEVLPEHFPRKMQLEKLLLNNNRLIAFDLTSISLVQLEVVDLSHNRLTDVERNSPLFDTIYELYLHNNSIKTLKLSSRKYLRTISLTENDWDCANLRAQLEVIKPSALLGYDDYPCKDDYIMEGRYCCKEADLPPFQSDETEGSE
ncbi:carboxypeptidase N subunit 2-like [Anopheles albimanus]|uniref:carboxypeptidase N subunit 2-like n=1 Tax=Anopheles albimanus TaxID=7167 RepID=UPI001640149F|nr:carboxypeptidase N subunit 2-like [Anopheles albimanus]